MTKKPSLNEQLCFKLYVLSRKITFCYQPDFEKLGITYLQYLIFLLFWEAQVWSVKELGQRLSLDSGTLTPLLKRMEEKGWVTRERDTKDQRSVKIELTPEGEKIQQQSAIVPENLKKTIQIPDEKVDEIKAQLDYLLTELN
ncbi:MarR family winged helix-turn-helix transcriptional regulator [Flagellimonas lutimaris]|uniref:MarR family winged helix-turn-helix transcriptional regulator n=1 Tax=Flagellimonas lutimaris TaxID=475082 RepID=UPI003F5CE838